MMNHRFALIALSVGLFCSVEGFSVGPVAFSRKTAGIPTSSTRLFVEETEADEVQEAAAGDIVVPRAGGDDILNSPAFLQRKLDVIKSDIAKVEEQITAAKAQVEEGKAEWGHQFEALEIEFQNIQNRFSKQGSKGDEDAVLNVARQMLEVLDNFDRAFKSVTAETDDEKAIEARYRKSYADILSIFKELGVTEVETVGKEFDYEFHQAVMQRADADYDEGIVCEELQKGYVLNGKRLVRAAMVSVAA